MWQRDSGLSIPEEEGQGDTLTFLRHAPFLRRLSNHDVLILATSAERQGFVQGAVILHEGEASDALYFVLHGRVEVLKQHEPGAHDDDTQPIHAIGRGSVFAEMSFLDGEPASATIRAATDCEVLRVAGATLDALPGGAGRPVRDRLNGAVASAVIARLRLTSQSHAEALQRELAEIRLRSHFERFFLATVVLFGIASLVQKTIQADTGPLAHMGLSWGFLLLSLAPMAWFSGTV